MKKTTLEILINFSGLKKVDEELYSKGVKLLKSLVRDLKGFFPHNLDKTVKINTASIEKDLKDIDLSKFKGFILDPYTLSGLQEIFPNKDLDVILFNLENTELPLDSFLRVHTIFDFAVEKILTERYKFFRDFIDFAIFLLKRYGSYKEVDFIYTLSSISLFPYLKRKDGLEFINGLKRIISNLRQRKEELKIIQNEHRLYTYKLREKLVIKDKQRRYAEIIELLIESSNNLSNKISPFPSILFVYDNSIYKDFFREWLLQNFLFYNFKDLSYKSFSPYSSEDGREIFGYIPNIPKEEDFDLGNFFENQGNIVILEDLPNSQNFFEKLFYYTNTNRVSTYGQRIEIFAPLFLIAFLEIDKFEKFKNYISFSHISKIPPPFLEEDPISIISFVQYFFVKEEKNIDVTHEALSFIKEAVLRYGTISLIWALKKVLMSSSNVLTKDILQDFLHQL